VEILLGLMSNTVAEKKDFRKWQVAIASTIVIGLISALMILLYGANEEGMRHVIRATGRYSFPLFVMSSLSSSLIRLHPVPWTQWLYANRRYIGISFATTYVFHGVGIVGLVMLTGTPGIEGFELIISLICYAFLAFMTVTSFDIFKQLLSKWAWDSIHSIGMLFFWYFFLQEYINKMFVSSFWYYMPLLLITASILPIKVIALSKPTKRGQPSITLH
jgi:methionine sulfoxide reductase heme-binding subunit